MNTRNAAPSERTRVRRKPERAAYERAAVDRILDAALVGHLGFCDGPQPFVIPVTFARLAEKLYLHGATSSRMIRIAAAGAPLCFEATLLDGLVLARSAFHHSLNYRSVVVLGRAATVDDPERKRAALARLVDRLALGRSAAVRPPTETELRATTVLELSLDEASAKVRSGGPVDDESDRSWPCWAGVVPLNTFAGVAIPAADLACDLPPPEPNPELELAR